jgi:hypothetical protein
MDRFIKIHSENISGKKSMHTKEEETLRKLVGENKNIFISGPSGVGKTNLVKNVLNGTKYFELDSQTLRFYYLCGTGISHIFIDNYEDDIAFKKIIDEISEGIKKTNGAVIVESQKFHLIPNFENIILQKPSVEQLLDLLDEGDDLELNRENAVRCDGNVREFMMYKNIPITTDKFFTTKGYITDILCSLDSIKVKDTLQEHGSFWDAIHENYLDSEGCNYVEIMNSLSLAEAHDMMIYEGNWESMRYFVNDVVSYPKFYMGSSLDPDKIRPGSCWSKRGNQRMRLRKVMQILKKGPECMHKEHLHLLKIYAQKGNIDILKQYNITAQDFDIVNHICVQNKLKQSDVNNIKKCLRK